jgi:hypothetical protein
VVRSESEAAAAPLVMAYVAGTAFWLFFPPVFEGATGDHYIAEINALLSYVTDAGGRLLPAGWAR